MDNFKGIYYGKCKDNKTFEGGAFFQYNELYTKLDELYQIMPNERKGTLKDDSPIPKSPLIKELVNRIKEITNVKIDEIKKDINKNNIDYNQMFPQCLTEESEEKDEGTNTEDNLFQLEKHFMETRNKIKIYEILNAAPNTKITLTFNNNTINNNVNNHKTQYQAKKKQPNIISPLCYLKRRQNTGNSNIDSFLKAKVKNYSCKHNKSSSNTSCINTMNTHKQQKRSIYQLMYNQKKSNEEKSTSLSKSKVQVTINNNIVIRPRINISFINTNKSKSKDKVNLSQTKQKIKQSRNGKFGVHFINLNSTIGHDNKTFNYGINEDIAKIKSNNSQYISENKITKDKINNLKALYKKRNGNTKLSYDFDHLFLRKEPQSKFRNIFCKGMLQYKNK